MGAHDPHSPSWVTILTRLDHRLSVLEARTDGLQEMQKKIAALNDWHNKVTGVLIFLSFMMTAGVGTAMAILNAVRGG